MPGSIAACAVSYRLCQVNFAGAVTWSDKAETEAFQASGGLNASRIQEEGKRFASLDYYLTAAPFSRYLIVDIPAVYCYDFDCFQVSRRLIMVSWRLDPENFMLERLLVTRQNRVTHQKATPQ